MKHNMIVNGGSNNAHNTVYMNKNTRIYYEIDMQIRCALNLHMQKLLKLLLQSTMMKQLSLERLINSAASTDVYEP